MKNLFFILIIGLTNQYVLAFFCSLKLPLTTWLILFQTQNDLEKIFGQWFTSPRKFLFPIHIQVYRLMIECISRIHSECTEIVGSKNLAK